MGGAKERREASVVIAQFGQHFDGGKSVAVLIAQSLMVGDVGDRVQRGLAEFPCSLGDRIGHRQELSGLLVQQQVIVTKLRTRGVPVKTLRLHVKREHVCQQSSKGVADVTHAFSRIRRSAKTRRWFCVWPESFHRQDAEHDDANEDEALGDCERRLALRRGQRLQCRHLQKRLDDRTKTLKYWAITAVAMYVVRHPPASPRL